VNDRESALSILQSRLDASVALIQALGGGWSAADLPDSHQVFRSKSVGPSKQ
jgi:outer membrane protein TolC